MVLISSEVRVEKMASSMSWEEWANRRKQQQSATRLLIYRFTSSSAPLGLALDILGPDFVTDEAKDILPKRLQCLCTSGDIRLALALAR
jgi:hypothetical protein